MTASECVTASPLSMFARNDRSYQQINLILKFVVKFINCMCNTS